MELEQLILSISTISIAVLAICVALYNGIQTKKQLTAQNIIKLREMYAGDEMLKGMKKIVEWKESHERREEDFAENFARLRDGYPDAVEVDEARRKFSQFVQILVDLYEENIVNEKFVKNMLKEAGVDFLINYVEPLEKVLPYPETPKHSFDTVYEIFGKDHVYEVNK